MNTPNELERLRGKLERVEHELGEVRRELTALERRHAAAQGVVSLAAVSPSVSGAAEAVVEPASARLTVQPTPESSVVVPVAIVPVSAAGPGDSLSPRPLPSATPPPLPATARERPAAMRQPAESSPLRGWLERLQLWPPAAGEGDAEARLGAWWATRIGAVLLVIGVVFFGVYVSLHTPPWVKFCELLVTAFGVTALGAWLERRLPAFGAVVFAGGLALVFFTAYAGYVAPAVRVFDSLWSSVAWQGVAVGLIVGAALWRGSPLIATLAIGLGHVTAIFSARRVRRVCARRLRVARCGGGRVASWAGLGRPLGGGDACGLRGVRFRVDSGGARGRGDPAVRAVGFSRRHGGAVFPA